MLDMVTLCYQVLEILLGSTDYSTWQTFGTSAASSVFARFTPLQCGWILGLRMRWTWVSWYINMQCALGCLQRAFVTLSLVLISGREQPEAPLSPAMDAVIRVFKCVTGLSESAGEAELSGAAGVAFCSILLLVASTQAINLIGKQGSLIKSIEESTAASVRVLYGGPWITSCEIFGCQI